MNALTFFLWQGQAPTPPQGDGGIFNYILLIVAFAVIYFVMIRPQNKTRKEQANFSQSLKKGKKVVTIGGVHGIIAEIGETTVDLIVAPKTIMTFQRDAISMDFTKAANGQQTESASTEKSSEEK